MSQVQPQVQNQPDNHDQSDVQYQPQTSDQLQSLVQIDLQSSSQSQLDIDARDFTFFSKLPLELQRDIWEIAAVPESRAIQIETICERDAQGIIHHAAVTTAADDDDDDDDDLLHWSPTKCSPTPLLGVCRDS